ncbi:MAG: pantoate--beta-alanine ligase [Elusimicrobia bacterium RIFOXYA2_FULL_39_19]|nr:MAG: pantoate--beta-alanine ligase [Elusimicrobia bacterium RIFOXYA2_FULL_39_19]
MKVVKNVLEMQKIALKLKLSCKTIGLIPTMGALHEGHLSLLTRSTLENDVSIVSIFVNPAQFGPGEDYLKYPRPFKKDQNFCKKNNADYLFAPSVKDMYAESYLTYIKVEKLSEFYCGKFRPGHFRGVTTVVAKLFNISQPNNTYFGEKDFQQLAIIKKMVNDLNFPVNIISCPTIRETDGLAKSSRNVYLNHNERKDANKIHLILKKTANKIQTKQITFAAKAVKFMKISLLKIPKMSVQYAEICDPFTLCSMKKNIKLPARILFAGLLGKTRLIDNIEIRK